MAVLPLSSAQHGTSSFSMILWALGWLVGMVGLFFLVPLGVSLYHGENFHGFLYGFFIAMTLGGATTFFFRHTKIGTLRLRDGFLLTIFSWLAISLCACLPFYFSHAGVSFCDALFEAVSSLTTTGISLFSQDYYVEKGLFFWRVFLQWLGGFGIILMAVTLLPILKIGGAHLVLSEFSDRTEKFVPRTSEVAASLMGLYIFLTVVIVFLLWAGKMPFFDALYYSMSALSTGGISQKLVPISSMGWYCKSVLIMAMMLGGSTLVLLVAFVKGEGKRYWSDDQIRFYYRMLVVASIVAFCFSWSLYDDPIITSIFMTVSALTTTGFSVGAVLTPFMHIFFLMLGFIGGCSGSTAGGIKVFRLQILYRVAKNQLLTSIQPYGLFVTSYNKVSVTENVVNSLITIIFFYITGWLLFALAYGALGYSVSESFLLSGGVITNSGLFSHSALTDMSQELCEKTKLLTMVGMLCGRFEFLTLFGALMIPFQKP